MTEAPRESLAALALSGDRFSVNCPFTITLTYGTLVPMLKSSMEKTHPTLVTHGVAEADQTLAAHKPFWVFFVTNASISTWLVGVLIATMKVDFGDALFVLVLGSALGAAVPSALAIMGPPTRVSQLEACRFALGWDGKRLPALLNWVGAVGMDVINNIVSATALVAFMTVFGIVMPFWSALAVLVAIQLVIGVYGHHVIQNTSTYTGFALGILFVVIGLIAMARSSGLPVTVPTRTSADMLSALALVMAYNISFAPYATDYTRYMPKDTPPRSIFLPIFLGLFFSLVVFAFFGYATAAMVIDASPQGVMDALKSLAGSFAPLVLLLVAFNSTPANAVNDNSAAYCLITAGVNVSRPVAAIFGAVVGFGVSLWASQSFIEFFENFLFLFAHGIAPWSAIILVHWAMIGRHATPLLTPPGFTRGFFLFMAVTALSIGLFSANSLYTGLLTNLVGGADIGPYIGFAFTALVYWLSLKLWPPAAFHSVI